MKAPPVMLIKRILLHILLVMLAQSNYQVDDSFTFLKAAQPDNLHDLSEKSANIVTISPENGTSNSEGAREPGNYNVMHIIYASASMGLCCPFIVACMYLCVRRYHAKHKRTPLTQRRQESLVRSQAAAPPHAAGTTQVSEESSSLYYCSMASPQWALHGNPIYDSHVPPRNAQRTAPNSDPIIPSIPALRESPDVLTYAALNHPTPAERCQRRKLAVGNEFTEYASINVEN